MKRRYKILIGIVIIFIIMSILPIIFQDSDQIGKFRTKDGELKYKKAYENAMKLVAEPSRTLDIETDYGLVRVYEFINSGNKSEVPIVLLPGRLSGTPMWVDNLEGLLSERTVYTIDILGDAGMSIQKKPIENAEDQALWLEQVFESVGLSQIHLMGHSFGGWNATNYAIHYPKRVMSLNLLEPVFVFKGLKWSLYIKSIPASVPFLPDSWREKMLEDIGGSSEIDMNDPLAKMISEATEHYSVVLPMPKVIEEDQLAKLDIPFYVALGGKSVIHNAQKVYDNALKSVKNLEIKLWKDGTHSLPMEYTDEINQELLEFMRSTDGLE